MDLPVTSVNNFDVVSYSTISDVTLTHRFFDLFETFVRMNINELTGMTYSEFKELTVLEQEMFINYVSFKIDTINIDVTDITNNFDNEFNDPFNI